MYKIGQFSNMAKTTIKTLRYYEKVGLLKPHFIDRNTGYRYYETYQMVLLTKIISLRQVGISVCDIKSILRDGSLIDILNKRKEELEGEIINNKLSILKINHLLEGDIMKNEVFIKDIDEYIIYYKEGVIEDFSHIAEFVLGASFECLKDNPNLKCVTPSYCYINYLDGEYKDKNIKIRYAEAVEAAGVENEDIKFGKCKAIKAVCIYHRGSYDNLRDSYNTILKYIEDHGYNIIDEPRECYIDGIWNKDHEADYLTEIQFPIEYN